MVQNAVRQAIATTGHSRMNPSSGRAKFRSVIEYLFCLTSDLGQQGFSWANQKESVMTGFAKLFFLTVLTSLGTNLTPAVAQETGAKIETLPLSERLPPKIQTIQQELPKWLQKTGDKKAVALMQKLRDQIESKNFEDAEKTADSILKLMKAGPAATGPSGDNQSDNRPTGSPEETTRRLTEKVERVQAGAQKWAASGRDPAEIAKTMQEKFRPLMEAGKVAEAEEILDGVLKQLGMDVNAPTAPSANNASAEERVLTRIHRIQKELPAWAKKSGRKDESDVLIQKLREQLAAMNFLEAEKTADAILNLMGVSAASVSQPHRPVPANNANQAADLFASFIPQQLVFLASDRIALTTDQRGVLLAKVNATQPRLVELKQAIDHETAALSELASQVPVNEAAVLAQLKKLLDVEREAKLLQASLGITIRNKLTANQQTMLRQLMGNPESVAKLEEEFKNRIDAKIASVTARAGEWAQSGRDPSFISQTMQERVRPLMESGRVFEAEKEIDLFLAQLEKAAK